MSECKYLARLSIISVNVKATASATVSNGKGAIVWASGNYYKGDLKNSKMHGVGTFQWAGGTKYVGQFGEFGLQRHEHEDARERQGGEGAVEGRQVPRVSAKTAARSVQLAGAGSGRSGENG